MHLNHGECIRKKNLRMTTEEWLENKTRFNIPFALEVNAVQDCLVLHRLYNQVLKTLVPFLSPLFFLLLALTHTKSYKWLHQSRSWNEHNGEQPVKINLDAKRTVYDLLLLWINIQRILCWQWNRSNNNLSNYIEKGETWNATRNFVSLRLAPPAETNAARNRKFSAEIYDEFISCFYRRRKWKFKT